MPDEREWTVPAPLRALLWWPATAFVLVLIAPDTAAAAIAVAGGVLAVLGKLVPVVARWARRPIDAARPAVDHDPPPVVPAPCDTAPCDTAPCDTAPFGTAPFGTAPFGTAPFGPAPVKIQPVRRAA